MERKLLFLFLVLFALKYNVFSQEKGKYFIKYSINIDHTRPSRLCYTNSINFSATRIRGSLPLEQYSGSGFKLIKEDVKYFDPSNKVKAINITAELSDRYGSVAPCLGDDDTNYVRNINLNEYPCISFFKRDFIDEDNHPVNDYVRVNIGPKVYLSFEKGKNVTKLKTPPCEDESIEIFASKNFDKKHKYKIYKWEYRDFVNPEYKNTKEYQRLLDQAEWAWNQYIRCNTGGGLDPIGGGCDIFLSEARKKQTAADKYEPKKDPTPIYSWKPLYKFNGQSSISIKLSDIYSKAEDREKSLGFQIPVRVNPSCNGEEDSSEVLQITFSPKPPKIVKAPVIPKINCSNSVIYNMAIYFNRQLKDGEKININFKKDKGKGEELPILARTGIGRLIKEGNLYKYTFTLNKNIESGNYCFDVSGTIKTKNGLIGLCDSGSRYPSKKGTYFKINKPKELIFNASLLNHQQCYGKENGKIRITATGGSGSYKYEVMKVGATKKGTFNRSVDVGVIGGTFRVQVTDSNGCVGIIEEDKTKSKSITVDPAVKIQQESYGKVLQHPSKAGTADGQMEVKVSGGAGGSYNYKVYKDGNTKSSPIVTGKINASPDVITGLPGGKHKIEYTDKNGCSIIYSLLTLKEPDPITFDVRTEKPDCFDSSSNGKIIVGFIYGGYANYKITVNDASGNNIATVENVSRRRVNIITTGVKPGRYSVTVTDARGISLKKESIIVKPQEELKIEKVNTSILCTGNIRVSITASGGKSKRYRYAINKARAQDIKWQSSNSFTLSANTRVQFLVKDAFIGECAFKRSKVMITPKNPYPIKITKTVTHNKVFGAATGSITLGITGGIPGEGYKVLWSFNGNLIDKRGSEIINLKAGFYTPVVVDKNPIGFGGGCIQGFDPIEVKENPNLVAKIDAIKDIKCFGDKASLKANVTGGVGNYKYEWFKNSKKITGATTNSLSNIEEGKYKVVIKDTYTSTTSDIVEFIEPKKLTVTTNKFDISCFGKNDGKIKLNITGGTGPYFYSIDDKTSYKSVSELEDNTITGLFNETYDVWVKDEKGCELEKSIGVSINEPKEIKIDDYKITHCDKNGSNDGAISIDVSGGKEGFTYIWEKIEDASFNESIQNISGLTAGNYKVIIKDNTDCEIEKIFEVKEPQPIKVTIEEVGEIRCFGKATGSLIAKVTGGYPIDSEPADFDYKWYLVKDNTEELLNSDMKTYSLSSLNSGNYKVVVNDVRGETTSSKIFNLTQPEEIKVSLEAKYNVKCYGGVDGKIDVSVSGGVGGYKYKWYKQGDISFSRSTQDIENLSIGNYKLEVTDVNKCTIESSFFKIEQPNKKLTINNHFVKNLSGFETGDGSITVIPDGGTPNYTYSWTKKDDDKELSNSNTVNNLEIGFYKVVIKDRNNCTVNKEYEVTQPDLLEITNISQSKSILCYQDKDVTLTPQVIGGVKPYSFKWFIKGENVEISNTRNLENVGGNDYVLQVTDANSIKAIKNYTINRPLLLDVLSLNVKHVSCYGGNDGSISIEAKGGVPPYTYSWNNGIIGKAVEKLSARDYIVTIRDKNQCEIKRKISVFEPLKEVFVESKEIISVSGNGLSNGAVKVQINGGTAPYNYEWKNEEGDVMVSTNNELLDVKAGKYFLNVIDKNLCELNTSFTVEEPLPLTLEISKIPILCKGEKGKLLAEVKGGVEPYTYKWYNSDGENIGSDKALVTVKGFVDLEVIDSNKNTTILKNIEFKEPQLLEISKVETENVTCYGGNDGSISVEVIGGIPPYVFEWEHGVFGAGLHNITANTYSLKVTDSNGCIARKEDIKIEEPEVYDIVETKLIRPSNDGGSNGSIHLKIIGGIPPYEFKWKDENDKIIVNSLVNEKEYSIDNLLEGKYTVEIIDSKNCKIKEAYNLASPGELLVSINQSRDITCYGGSDAIIDVISVGGVGGNNYKWYNVDDVTKVISTKKQLINVPSGKYYVVVDNALGIIEQSSVFTVEEPSEITLSITKQDSSCFEANDGSVRIDASGGTNGYKLRYRLDNDVFSDWISFENKKVLEINELSHGQYFLQLKDGNNCRAINSDKNYDFTFRIENPDLFSIGEFNSIEPSGFGLSNGSIEVKLLSGTPPNKYILKNELGNVVLNEVAESDSFTINSLSAGKYDLIVTDSKDCEIKDEFVLNGPDKLKVSINMVSIISCLGTNDGVIEAEPKGGVGQYKFSWFKQEESDNVLGEGELLENIGAGTYFVEVEDANGNKVKSEFYVFNEPEDLKVDLLSNYTLCGTGNDWEIKALVEGGTAPYSYLWSKESDNLPILNNLVAGNYSVTVVDANGCSSVASIVLTPPDPIEIRGVEITNPTCFEGKDGSIILDVIGGTPPYTFKWNDELEGNPINNLFDGVYDVLITDSKGCFLKKTFEIINPRKIEFDLGEEITLCKGQTYVFDATIDEGVEYKWISNNGFSSSKAEIEVSEAGIYSVFITTDLGCSVSDSIEVIEAGIEINSNFLMSTQVYTGESFVMVNTSSPSPDEIEWILPKNAKVIQNNNNYAEIVLDNEGEYEITLVTRIGNCEEVKTKKVVVLEKEILENENQEEITKLIKTINLYPNPSSGSFNLDIELEESNSIIVKFYRLNGSIIDYKKYTDKSLYEIDYNFNLPTGVYFILIETKKDKFLKKVIVR